ncbi:hypothetical protein M9434_005452 [Picochlorum sp. BPE23]|nr:hypothetical protein M9434_005452 [Picochlorum sp. BPE23]
MTSPTTTKTAPFASRLRGFINGIKRTVSRNEFSEGSSRRGRTLSDADDLSYGKESSTRSIMFDLELSQKGARATRDLPSSDSLPECSLENPVVQRLKYLARPVASFEIELLQDVRALASSLRESCAGSVPIAQLASDLAAMGYNCSIHGKLDGTTDHQCLIDPQFRDQFLLGKHNQQYETLLQSVPLEFVGSPLRLQALAAVICSEMTKVYQELGISLPPWRKPNAVLGKWFDTTSANSQGMQGARTDISQQQANQTKGSSSAAPEGKRSSNFFSILKMHKDSVSNKGQKTDRSTSSAEVEKSNKPHRQGKSPSPSGDVSLEEVQRKEPSRTAGSSQGGHPTLGRVSLLAQGLQQQH